jgi:hypothetical protein
VGFLLPTVLLIEGLMDRLTLYNLALSLLDLHIDDLETPSKELTLLNLNYAKVVSFCMKAWEFPFLIKRQVLTDYEQDAEGNPVTWNGFSYGYAIPSDFGRAIQLNSSKKNPYAYRFGLLWSKMEAPELEYIPRTLSVDENGTYPYPDDFLALVAYQLALHIAPMLDPDGQAQSIAAQMYQLTLSSIIESETRSNDRAENFNADAYWDGDIYVTQEAIRDAIVKGEL